MYPLKPLSAFCTRLNISVVKWLDCGLFSRLASYLWTFYAKQVSLRLIQLTLQSWTLHLNRNTSKTRVECSISKCLIISACYLNMLQRESPHTIKNFRTRSRNSIDIQTHRFCLQYSNCSSKEDDSTTLSLRL